MSEEDETGVAYQLSSSEVLLSHVQQSLQSCSKAVQSGDFAKSEALTRAVGDFIFSIADAAISYPDNLEHQNKAILSLSEIQKYILDPCLSQEVIDALSFELPKAVANFSGVSERCLELVEVIIGHFTEKCSPRDMISILSEAIDCYGKITVAPAYLSSLLQAQSKVILSIQRRHYEQVKVALPVILKALEAASCYCDDDAQGLEYLYERAIGVATAILVACNKLEGRANELLHALLALYIFQLMSLISIRLGDDVLSATSLVLELARIYPLCGLSYSAILMGPAVDNFLNLVTGDPDDFEDCFCFVKPGACLSVVWGYILDEIAQAAKQDLAKLMEEIRSSQIKRWQAIEMLGHILSAPTLPWTIKKHSLNFVLSITDSVGRQEASEDIESSVCRPQLLAALQVLIKAIMHSPDVDLRRCSLTALKMVMADIPASLRLDILQVLVKNSDSSSMTAILLDCVREDLQKNYRRKSSTTAPGRENALLSTSSWSESALNLVELVLRPPCGGPPSLPEQSDAVLSALNLYRYILLTESTGGTNFTEVLSNDKLRVVHEEWLLPLRILVTGIISENKTDYDQICLDVICSLYPVEVVLYRCIELVEEKLK